MGAREQAQGWTFEQRFNPGSHIANIRHRGELSHSSRPYRVAVHHCSYRHESRYRISDPLQSLAECCCRTSYRCHSEHNCVDDGNCHGLGQLSSPRVAPQQRYGAGRSVDGTAISGLRRACSTHRGNDTGI